jgi:hypothetical protein
VNPLSVPEHIHGESPVPGSIQDIAERPVPNLIRQRGKGHGLVEWPAITYVDVIFLPLDPYPDRGVHIAMAHVAAQQVGVVARFPQQFSEKRICGIARATQIVVIEAVEEFRESGDAPFMLARDEQELGDILKRNPDHMLPDNLPQALQAGGSAIKSKQPQVSCVRFAHLSHSMGRKRKKNLAVRQWRKEKPPTPGGFEVLD